MKIAILGFAGQGKAAYDYWNKPENTITICDRNKQLEVPEGAATQLGEHYLHGLDQFDVLVRTPALHPHDITAANPDAPAILQKVTTVTNEFFKVCPSPIIGVTGTKGKGTTSTLIAKLLETAGYRVHLGGNIGIPPLELLKDNISHDDWVILELANFQLIDLQYSPHIAVCLMVAPEHLDWHTDLAEYVTAKQQLFRYQQPTDLAVGNGRSELSQKVVSVSQGTKLFYEVPPLNATPTRTESAYVDGTTIYMQGTPVCQTSEVALRGRHNLENICAAITATWELIKHDTNVIKQVVGKFTGLEHRLELVREVNGVQYFDDSFGTTPETAVVALEAFDQPEIAILGGSDKGGNYRLVADAVVANNVRTVVKIGDTGKKIEQFLHERGYDNVIDGGTSMPEIVRTAQAQAQPGDVVLLSTASASFDMFKNYKDRGEQFKTAVNSLG